MSQVQDTRSRQVNESKSHWFRRLSSTGMTINDIHKFTGIRYQHVRNVIKQAEDKVLLQLVDRDILSD